MHIFIPITKVDAAKRIVYGTLTQAVADKSGEIIDYESTKAAYKKWSDDTFERSGGKSKGNLRAMHGNVAAGKFTDIVFDDANQKIEGAAYVSDDNEWKKCEDGTYTGFSHGGSYAKRWDDPSDPSLKRYTPTLAEVSLVDNPCVPTATFEFIKADGSTELRKFITQGVDMTEKTADGKAEEIQKTAVAEAMEKKDGESEGRPQDKGGVLQGFQAKDGSFHVKKADALKRNEAMEVEAISQPALDALKSLAAAVTKAESGVKKSEVVEADGEAEGAAKDAEVVADKEPAEAKVPANENKEADKAADPDGLEKGMYSVSALASLLADLNYLRSDALWEAQAEGDNSTVPGKLKVCVNSLAEVLKEMVGEETAELTADKSAKGGELAKKGATLSAATKAKISDMVKSASDHHDTMKKSYADMCGEDTANKATPSTDLNKAVMERDALQKVLDGMTPQINELVKRVEQLESQPMPSKGVLRVVEKAADGQGNAEGGDEVQKLNELLKGKSPEEANMMLMKSALSNPRPLTR